MSNLALTIGISGCGKSFFTENELVKKEGYVEVNADNIRRHIFHDISDQSHNKEVFEIADNEIDRLINEDKNVVNSNTNLNIDIIKSYIERYSDICDEIGIYIMMDSFDKNLCWNRICSDLEEGKVRSKVPKYVHDMQYERFIKLYNELSDMDFGKKNIKIYEI